MQIIKSAVADGLSDDQIKIMLGYPPGPIDRHEMPDQYDVDVSDGDDEDVQPPPSDSGAQPQQATADSAPAAKDSGKAILSHLAGLLTHLSK